jgi:hypothetical protein
MAYELRTFVDIDATPERVWQVLIDVAAYPQWNPFVTSAEGTYAVGSRLSFIVPSPSALSRVTVRPTVLEVTPYRRLRSRGRWDRFGIPGLFDAEHILTITPHGAGVRLWQEERIRGLLAPLLTRSVNRLRLPAFNAMNAALKDRIEGRQPTHPDL